ncbi:PilW family protein [Pseudomonas sp. NPDC087358]|uniref:PilW family protein n=1 Tax=Pseudomonas sp. NPDC087358 TaxID=3364439 RepID=UPI00384BFA5F
MMRHARGFGLVEIMLALALGLVMSLALTQVFISAKSTYMSQVASANLQQDARFVLSKMIEELRRVGMSGCLANIRDASLGGQFSSAIKTPVQWDARQQSLSLISAVVGNGSAWHTWVIHTDCASSATAWSRGRAPRLAPGETALPIHQQVYRFNERRGELTLNGQPLLSNVRAFTVLFGVADRGNEPGIARYTAQPDTGMIRSVRLTLTLFDPDDRTQEQTFKVVAAIRNRLG